jgi:hypothetical protein
MPELTVGKVEQLTIVELQHKLEARIFILEERVKQLEAGYHSHIKQFGSNA